MTTGLASKNSDPTIWPRCKWQRCNFYHQDPEVVTDHEAVCDRRVVVLTYEQRRAKVERNRRRQEVNAGRPLGGEAQRDNRDIDDLIASIETPGAVVPALLPPRLIKARQLKALRRPRVVVARVRAILQQRRASVLPPDSISPLLDSTSSPPESVSPPLDISGFRHSGLPTDSGSFHISPTPFRAPSQPFFGRGAQPPATLLSNRAPLATLHVRGAVLPPDSISPLLDSPSSPPDSVSPPLDISGFHHSALPTDSGSFHRSPTPFRSPRAGTLGERPRSIRGSAVPPVSSPPLATLQVRDDGIRLAGPGRGFIGYSWIRGAQPPVVVPPISSSPLATLEVRGAQPPVVAPPISSSPLATLEVIGAQLPAALSAGSVGERPMSIRSSAVPPVSSSPLAILPAPPVPPGFHDRPRLPVPQIRLPLPAPRVPPGFHGRPRLPVPQFRLQPLPAPPVPPGFLDRPPVPTPRPLLRSSWPLIGFQPPPPPGS